jgi:hypothetical protein
MSGERFVVRIEAGVGVVINGRNLVMKKCFG